MHKTQINSLPDKNLMILDDDHIFRNRLCRAMLKRGFIASPACNIKEAKKIASENPPAFAILDMKLEDGNGLDIVIELKKNRPDCRIVMLTGYGNIASAVSAVKLGAIDYLAKPVDAEALTHALLVKEGKQPKLPNNPMSANRVRWEYIQRVYELCEHNVSETARRLNMHRRTLQRILAKKAPK